MSQIKKIMLSAALVVGTMGAASLAIADEPQKPGNRWLLDAKNDTERFKRIEDMFGGFSSSMIVVGERFDRTYDAIIDGNHKLAAYHWQKIRELIEAGAVRRPERERNAALLFLKGYWHPLNTALAENDLTKIKGAFLEARNTCMECHRREDRDFINDQPRFRKTAEFPAK